MNNYKYFKCFDGPSESWFCWMFLLFLFKSKTRQRKSLGLPLTNYNINPHQCVSELSCILDVDPYRVSHSLLTPTLHSLQYLQSEIWSCYKCCLQRQNQTKNWNIWHPNHHHRMIWMLEWSLLAIFMVKPNFLLLFFWGIIWTTEAHFTYFDLSGSKNKT